MRGEEPWTPIFFDGVGKEVGDMTGRGGVPRVLCRLAATIFLYRKYPLDDGTVASAKDTFLGCLKNVRLALFVHLLS